MTAKVYTEADPARLGKATQDLLRQEWRRETAAKLYAGAIEVPVMPGRTQLAELLRSGSAAKAGITNKPDAPLHWERLLLMCVIVDDALMILDEAGLHGGHVNSGYRNDVVNRLAGGSKTSDHLRALGADIGIPGVTDYGAAALVLFNNRQKFRVRPQQIISEPGHVHLGIPDERERAANTYVTELRHKNTDGHFELLKEST